MGKVLKVLVVLLLILNCVAIFFATRLYSSRETLKVPAQKLPEAIMGMASYIEDAPKTEAEAAEGETPAAKKTLAGELSSISQDLQTTSRTKLWEAYNLDLEETDTPKASISSSDLKPSTAAGIKKMSDMAASIQEKAKAQMEKLTDTRIQLKSLREEYVATVKELDKKALDLAAAEGTLAKHALKIEEMEGQIHPLREEKETLEASLKELQASTDEQTTAMDTLTRKLTEANDEIARLQKKAKDEPVPQITQTAGTPQQASALHIEPGFKGRVSYFDPTWNFVVIELHEDFIKELLGEDMNRALPEGVELLVYRQGDKGAFVTKVELSNIRVKEGLAVANVITSWNDEKWFPVTEGDGVFF